MTFSTDSYGVKVPPVASMRMGAAGPFRLKSRAKQNGTKPQAHPIGKNQSPRRLKTVCSVGSRAVPEGFVLNRGGQYLFFYGRQYE